jgi:hypothetical protein
MNDEEKAARYERLPKWAQEEIALLEMRLKEACAERDAAIAAPQSNVAIRRWAAEPGEPKERWLPENAEVTFYVGKSRDRIAVRISDNGVTVNAWCGMLRVSPRAANSILIEAADR